VIKRGTEGEGQKDGRTIRQRDGGMEGWRDRRMEEWSGGAGGYLMIRRLVEAV
jgi:hypothetical protein